MSILSFPYISILSTPGDPTTGDRFISAGEFAQGFDLIMSSGVVYGKLNELAPAKVAGTLNVSIDTGAAYIEGHFIINDASTTVTLDAGDAQPRIDVVVCESNESSGVRAGRFTVVKGTPAGSPVAPALTNDGSIEQIALAEIEVPALAASLDTATLTDGRAYAEGRHVHSYTDIDGLAAQLSAKLNSASFTGANILAALLPVDGTGTGLDADKVDGQDASAFAAASHTHDSRYYTETEINTLLGNKYTCPVSGGEVKFSSSQPSLDNGDIWLKDLGVYS